MMNSNIFSEAKRIIRPESKQWPFYLKTIYYEKIVTYLNSQEYKVTSLFDFEIWLISMGYGLLDLTALNKEEPGRIYIKGDYSKPTDYFEMVSIIYDTSGDYIIQLNDSPTVYFMPNDPTAFRKALQGKLARV